MRGDEAVRCIVMLFLSIPSHASVSSRRDLWVMLYGSISLQQQTKGSDRSISLGLILLALARADLPIVPISLSS